MWKGPVTDELRELAQEYRKRFGTVFVDGYDDFNFNAMTYEEFVSLIKEALEKNVEIPELFDDE